MRLLLVSLGEVVVAESAPSEMPEAALPNMLAGVRKMIPATQKCGQDDKVRPAFAKLDINRKT